MQVVKAVFISSLMNEGRWGPFFFFTCLRALVDLKVTLNGRTTSFRRVDRCGARRPAPVMEEGDITPAHFYNGHNLWAAVQVLEYESQMSPEDFCLSHQSDGHRISSCTYARTHSHTDMHTRTITKTDKLTYKII